MNLPDLPAFLRDRCPLVSHLTPDELGALVGGSETVWFEDRETVMESGRDTVALGVVLEGAVAAEIGAPEGPGEVLGQLGIGKTFGEMGLMSGEPSAAGFRAVGRTQILWIPLALFRSLIMSDPAALQFIAQTIGERLHAVSRHPSALAALGRSAEAPDPLILRSARREHVLVVNCGSSSLKYMVFDTADTGSVIRGQVERIGMEGTRLSQRAPGGEVDRPLPNGDHGDAFAAMVEALADPAAGAGIGRVSITAIGHRVVHGGERFTGPAVISDGVLAEIDALAPLAPLHNPVNAVGIREARRLFASVPQVAVFDTAFHATLPKHAYLYGLPHDLSERHGIRRYGFHGTSHAHVALAAARHLGRGARELRIVSCHLGNGASICAIDHGRSVDTSMGFTPAEGLLMGTRCGDIDPGVAPFLQRMAGIGPDAFDALVNRESGLLGCSGVSSDMREIEAAAEAGDARALTALKMFCYRVRKYIGAYVAAMGGIDALVFTGGIGQGSSAVRAAAVQGLAFMGVTVDPARNREAAGGTALQTISAPGAPVPVLVIPAEEERMIARETLRALERQYLVQASAACRTQPVPIEVSAHHIHLCQPHVEALFGPGHQLTHHADLSQPGQYACKEQVTLVGPKGRIERVRVLGPARKATQVEIAMTEQFRLGIHPPIRESGSIDGTPGCTLEGPAGSVVLDRGVICALRHIHMTPADALRYGVRDKCTVRVRVAGDREMIFGDVLIRVDPSYALAMHIDTDEANAANLRNGAEGFIDGIQGEE